MAGCAMAFYLLAHTAYDAAGVDELVRGPLAWTSAHSCCITALYDHGAKHALAVWYQDNPRPREQAWDTSSIRQEIAAWRAQQGWDPGSLYLAFVTWLVHAQGCHRVGDQLVAIDHR